MTFREAVTDDIQQLSEVRMSVKENVLTNKSLVTDEHYREYLAVRGKGWVCEVNNVIAGFAIADIADDNVWALFVRPEYEQMGIGETTA